jgi:hypothetical protein
MKINIIGFNFPGERPEKYKCRIIHPDYRLVQSPEGPDKLFCPMCETSYSEKDPSKDEHFMPKFGTESKTQKHANGSI